MIPLVDVLVEDEGWDQIGADCEALCRQAAAMALAEAGLGDLPAEVSVLLTSDAEIAKLNRAFRNKDKATNVLSWPSLELTPGAPGMAPPPPRPRAPGQPVFLGDIALARETVQAEAAEQGKRTSDHATHLVAHAVLHLLGYDHETDADARLMEGLETRAMLRAGLADPYMDRTAAEIGSPAGRDG